MLLLQLLDHHLLEEVGAEAEREEAAARAVGPAAALAPFGLCRQKG